MIACVVNKTILMTNETSVTCKYMNIDISAKLAGSQLLVIKFYDRINSILTISLHQTLRVHAK